MPVAFISLQAVLCVFLSPEHLFAVTNPQTDKHIYNSTRIYTNAITNFCGFHFKRLLFQSTSCECYVIGELSRTPYLSRSLILSFYIIFNSSHFHFVFISLVWLIITVNLVFVGLWLLALFLLHSPRLSHSGSPFISLSALVPSPWATYCVWYRNQYIRITCQRLTWTS